VSHLTLQRVKQDDFATYGEWYSEKGRRECVSLEPPAHGEHPCIPAGEYICERRHSAAHHGIVFGVLDVPGRSDIEIHVGNLPCDTLGCILLGLDFGHVEKATGESGDGVLGSKAAFLSFMADHPEQRFTLSVLDPFPSSQEQP
jgi:hypothetical protein